MTTLNGKLFCEPYTGGKALQSEVKSGFATVKQKANIVGLKLKADAIISLGPKTIVLKKGKIVFFNEETLFNYKNYHTPITHSSIEGEFVIADFAHIVSIDEELI